MYNPLTALYTILSAGAGSRGELAARTSAPAAPIQDDTTTPLTGRGELNKLPVTPDSREIPEGWGIQPPPVTDTSNITDEDLARIRAAQIRVGFGGSTRQTQEIVPTLATTTAAAPPTPTEGGSGMTENYTGFSGGDRFWERQRQRNAGRTISGGRESNYVPPDRSQPEQQIEDWYAIYAPDRYEAKTAIGYTLMEFSATEAHHIRPAGHMLGALDQTYPLGHAQYTYIKDTVTRMYQAELNRTGQGTYIARTGVKVTVK